MKVQLKDVRLAFPALFEAKSVNGEGEPRFSACFIIEPKSANAKALSDAIASVAKDKWGAKALTVLQALEKKDRVCFHLAPKTNKSGDVYDGFEGTFHVNASNKARPTVVGPDRSPLVASDGKPYGGCYVNAVVEIWAQDNNWGQRVNATLGGVQFVRDGDAFSGGAPVSADEFDDISEGAEESLA